MKKYFSLYNLLIFSLLFAVSCGLEDPNIGTTTQEVIAVSASADELLADGTSRLTLTAELLEKADPNLDITFTTEAGFFPGNGAGAQQITVTASGRTAEVMLQSDNQTVSPVIVSAAVSNHRATAAVEFIRALPDDVVSSADRQTVTADRVDFARLTTKLFRDIGMPTVGTRVNYEIIEQDTASASIVPFDFTDENHESIVEVKSENGKPGVVLVRITVAGTEEEEIIEIEFTEA